MYIFLPFSEGIQFSTSLPYHPILSFPRKRRRLQPFPVAFSINRRALLSRLEQAVQQRDGSRCFYNNRCTRWFEWFIESDREKRVGKLTIGLISKCILCVYTITLQRDINSRTGKGWIRYGDTFTGLLRPCHAGVQLMGVCAMANLDYQWLIGHLKSLWLSGVIDNETIKTYLIKTVLINDWFLSAWRLAK